ncbi:MAG: exodeoxyribonuclease VII large subunit [Oscillospiraceae bacterium]|nr:exodeoxyribonuclease VII large subunit [Oscillospiraceae bacterium]
MSAMTVSQINHYLKTLIEQDAVLSGIQVSGEISNYKRYPSGHHYFTLKDPEGVLRAVLFRSDALRLSFDPADGIKVLASGRISLYPRDGVYQLYCRTLLPDGQGALTMAYEALKAKLEEEGLFDPAHKKPLPARPYSIVLITSLAGAAVRDMIRILGRRWPLCSVIIIPVRVQGEEAPGEIVSALQYANTCKLGDVIIMGRGGGSLEDLWAFNEEQVARAIFASVIPVISAVGHEPDITISDYVADIRAATPSHAAELAVPDQSEWLDRLNNLQVRLPSMLIGKVKKELLRLEPLCGFFKSPGRLLDYRRQQADGLTDLLYQAWQKSSLPRAFGLSELAARLDALSPLKVMGRGYSVCQTSEGTVVTHPGQVAPGDEICVRLLKGEIKGKVTG